MNLVYDFIELSFQKLIFPVERPKHTTKFTAFFLEYDAYIDDIDIFEFHAVQDRQLESHTLFQLPHNLFVVHHIKYGYIYFGASLISDACEYVGKSNKVSKSKKFIRLFPLDNDGLNFLCEFKNFFFVGYVDRNIEKPYEELY
ncbi:hypothetical protein K8B33_08530 [Alcanivorax sp. JB21]|uniref:hypothetical protein n=1 Tax=Alcanivorax limicola TaxID=2874102 RepID=UPI001CC154E2|nr:hypothetical protein [Alcanivorax limicola]MBZ2189141.1 hypothetical protein [Alcanivorax limicola]